MNVKRRSEGTRYALRPVSRLRDRRAAARRPPKTSSSTRSSAPDEKAIVATVEPAHELTARARIGGTIASLSVKEGDRVAAGQEIAVVADEKLVLQRQALDSRIQSQQSQRDKAKSDYDRAVELQKRGVGTQVQVDATKTALDVADRTLSAMGSDRDVLDQQMKEGAALAPGAGRVLQDAGHRGLGGASGRDDRDHRRGPLHPAPAASRAPRAVHARGRRREDRRARLRRGRRAEAKERSASSIRRSRADG